MDMVADESADVVVITLVLCSVQDAEKVLQQAKRILVPGGKLFFLEHVKEFDDDQGFRKMWQEVLTKTGIWPFFFDGCELNRKSYDAINNAGFSEVMLEKKHAPSKELFYFFCSLAVGVATK